MAFFTELPGVVGSGLAGVLVDRWPRQRMLLLADAGQAVTSVLLLLSFLSSRCQIWQLYGIVLVILASTGVIYALPLICTLEDDLPDYAALEAEI
jgi:predicted MFS family arabinose efflux permease